MEFSSPSKEDIQPHATARRGSRLLGIRLHDHVVGARPWEAYREGRGFPSEVRAIERALTQRFAGETETGDPDRQGP